MYHIYFQFLPNGTLSITRVYMEDKGKYGCTANNTAGKSRREAYLNVASKYCIVFIHVHIYRGIFVKVLQTWIFSLGGKFRKNFG